MSEEYEIWLAGIRHLGGKKKKLLREKLGSAREVYNIEETQIEKVPFLTENEKEVLKIEKKRDIKRINEEMNEKEINFLPYYSKNYPKKLKEIYSPPYALYYKGSLDLEAVSVGIVGSRAPTPYGEGVALEVAEALGKAGVTIVSGMARGIDSIAHRGALNAGGLTYGILGCGVDICYPREHRGIYSDLIKCGGVLSEYPPNTKPFKSHFPARNRIISGLCDSVFVVEARKRSGSLITADMALEQGREVYALPGPITSPLSEGCNNLIQEGANIFLSVEKLMEEMKINGKISDGNSKQNKKTLERTEFLLYSCLDFFPKNLEELVKVTKLDIGEVLKGLIELELEGIVKEISKNYYVKIKEI
ncbi:DNA processing protein [Aequitasia blattaphilus]|uniref:DNA-processing protein DprA n=1 Tax=Aequitasia blattaphilus TaxID=2949332 RepID=A0ABT1E7K3_9FIRM|nr:DNA-processing protein DprA [Aequitasia blattaphilus]MCP1101763.1 DNA-processing protein DprA [Aequitasia blattaphilus]MCR8614403.1 DNA-processing protein DprA [Aequitasia blattaphilus]